VFNFTVKISDRILNQQSPSHDTIPDFLILCYALGDAVQLLKPLFNTRLTQKVGNQYAGLDPVNDARLVSITWGGEGHDSVKVSCRTERSWAGAGNLGGHHVAGHAQPISPRC
jgi:hypothetical protein